VLRRRRVILSEALVVNLLQHGSEHRFRVVHGLPEDASVLLITKDRTTGMLELEFLSSVFEPIPDGKPAPVLPIVCEAIPGAD